MKHWSPKTLPQADVREPSDRTPDVPKATRNTSQPSTLKPARDTSRCAVRPPKSPSRPRCHS
eukprot:15172638-Alexandrium_andersonii.AAC.1